MPEDGYVWDDPASSSMAVVWAPHEPNHLHPHITSHAEEGKWTPDPGYRFLNPERNLDILWTSEQPDPAHAHVVAGTEEGIWVAQDGYSWVVPVSSTMTVVWTPNRASRLHPHVLTGEEEGKWINEPGYRFVNPTKNWNVTWEPQISHPYVPHILAGNMEGTWVTEQGYHFERDKNGNTVIAQGPDLNANVAASSLLGNCAKGSAVLLLTNLLVHGAALIADGMGCMGACTAAVASWTIPSAAGSLAVGCAGGMIKHMMSDPVS